MENIVFNLSPGTLQVHQDFGHFLVAEGTMIVPGVLNGSLGPLYYPSEEIEASASLWNSVPLLINHPAEGRGKDVLESQGVGHVENSRFVDGKLKASLWFDTERTKKLAVNVYDALVNNQQVELSTGLQTTNEVAEEGSTFNNPIDGLIPYTHIARDYRPDHLAILPDQIGACSIMDGCGVNNKLSEDDVRSSLRASLQERFTDDTWVEDLFANEVIFLWEGSLHKLKYTRARDKVTLSDDPPVQVQRVTTYKVTNTLDDQSGTSDSTLNSEETTMAEMTKKQKTKIVDELITNSCCWEEEDREELVAMTDNQLSRTKEAADKQTENEELLAVAEAGFNDDRDTVTFNQEKKAWERITKPQKDKGKEPVKNEKKQLTEDEFLAMAPESVKNTLAHAASIEQDERKRLIEQITANVDANAKPEIVSTFGSKPLNELKQIASLMPRDSLPSGQSPSYYGGQPQADMAVENENLDQEDILIPEEIDFVANSAFADK